MKILTLSAAFLVLSALAAGGPSGARPAASAPAAPPPGLLAPLDLPALLHEGRAAAAHPPLREGSVDAVFDGNLRTAVRAASSSSEAAFQVTLDRPRAVEESDVAFAEPGAAYRWSLAGAQTEADMRSRSGSFRMLVAARE